MICSWASRRQAGNMQYTPLTEPMKHQHDQFMAHGSEKTYALFWEQGTGKTKESIDEMCLLIELGLIDAVLLVAPNGVHKNWLTDEIPVHMPQKYRDMLVPMIYKTESAAAKWHQMKLDRTIRANGIPMLLFSYDGFCTDRGKKAAWSLLRKRKCLYILDEAHHIKTPGAKKTKTIVASGRYAPYKRLLTGTPVSAGPFDVYSQMKFLDEGFWNDIGCNSFQAFKTRFGIWEKGFNRKLGREYPVLVSYRDLDVLQEKLKTMSSRVLKEHVLDLPPKIHNNWYYEMTPQQERVYNQLREEFLYDHGDGRITNASLAIVRLLRFQQVLCGYLPFEDEEGARGIELIPGGNPRLDSLHEAVSGFDKPYIVWARFTKDIELIKDRLESDGHKVATYYGGNSNDQNERHKLGFQAGDFNVFLGNPAKGAEGLTLNQAKWTYYYNNSFRLIHRLQSEDRNHRKGQTDQVGYTDMICEDSVDEHYVRNLVQKVDVAAKVTGDQIKEWLVTKRESNR